MDYAFLGIRQKPDSRGWALETAHKWIKWTMRFKRKGTTKGPDRPIGYSEIVWKNPAAKLDHARELAAA